MPKGIDWWVLPWPFAGIKLKMVLTEAQRHGELVITV